MFLDLRCDVRSRVSSKTITIVAVMRTSQDRLPASHTVTVRFSDRSRWGCDSKEPVNADAANEATSCSAAVCFEGNCQITVWSSVNSFTNQCNQKCSSPSPEILCQRHDSPCEKHLCAESGCSSENLRDMLEFAGQKAAIPAPLSVAMADAEIGESTIDAGLPNPTARIEYVECVEKLICRSSMTVTTPTIGRDNTYVSSDRSRGGGDL